MSILLSQHCSPESGIAPKSDYVWDMSEIGRLRKPVFRSSCPAELSWTVHWGQNLPNRVDKGSCRAPDLIQESISRCPLESCCRNTTTWGVLQPADPIPKCIVSNVGKFPAGEAPYWLAGAEKETQVKLALQADAAIPLSPREGLTPVCCHPESIHIQAFLMPLLKSSKGKTNSNTESWERWPILGFANWRE